MPAFRSGMGEKLGPKKKNINIFTCSKHDVLSGTANILEAVVNYWPIPLLHASSHDSINLGADRSDGAHGRVLCKCDEREVYSRKKKKNRFIYVSYISTSISIISPPPSEKGPAALLRGSLVLVWLTPSTAAPPPGCFTHNLGGPCRISFKSRAQIIVWTRKCISALSCSSSCHSAS